VLSPLDELPGGHHILQSTPCRVGQASGCPCDEKLQNAVLAHLVHYTRQCHGSRAWHSRSHTPSVVDSVMPCSQGITRHFHYGVKVPIETKWKSYALTLTFEAKWGLNQGADFVKFPHVAYFNVI
jgi:hypothetical protein